MFAQTFHAVAVRGQWKWILSQAQFEYYSVELPVLLITASAQARPWRRPS